MRDRQGDRGRVTITDRSLPPVCCTTLATTSPLHSPSSPTSCYFAPRHRCQPHLSRATPPHPAPSLLLPARVGCGFAMGVSLSNFRNHIAGLLLTGRHVTHQRLCCTQATLPLHTAVHRHAHTQTSSGAGKPLLSGSIHKCLNNLSES